jgi:TonB family protein
MKNGQVVSKWIEVQINFNLYQDPQKKEEQETRERRERETALKAWQMDGQDGQEIRVRLGDEAGRRAEREAQQKRDAILAGLAKISMDHAIQIANSKVPGKVTECSLVGEHWEGEGELAKPSLVLYHVVVLSDDATPVKTHVLINAMDGSVFRVSKEDAITLRPFMKGEEEMTGYATLTADGVTRNRRTIEGGVLNGKTTSMPAPQYPAIARDAHVTGSVNVRVVIDGDGNVVEATAVSGHPLLRAAAMAAAKEAKLAPTRLNGEPVAVSGVLVYNFVAQ